MPSTHREKRKQNSRLRVLQEVECLAYSLLEKTLEVRYMAGLGITHGKPVIPSMGQCYAPDAEYSWVNDPPVNMWKTPIGWLSPALLAQVNRP